MTTYGRSDEINELVTALIEAQKSMGSLKKTGTADAGKYSYQYATFDEVVEVAKKPLTNNGLVIIQFPINDGEWIGVETILAHASGQFITRKFETRLDSNFEILRYLPDDERAEIASSISRKNHAQVVGSLITYYRRYAYMAAIGLVPEDDDGAAVGPVRSNDDDGGDKEWSGDKITEKQRAAVFAIGTKEFGLNNEGLHQLLEAKYKAKSISDLTKGQASNFIDAAKDEKKSQSIVEWIDRNVTKNEDVDPDEAVRAIDGEESDDKNGTIPF